MPAGKRIERSKTAREQILKGMLEVSKTVSSTYGPCGRTVGFDRGGSFRITKDGITVAREIKFSDEAKNFGAMLIKEAAGKSNYISGDGSSSTTILTAELCAAAHNLLNQGIDINDLRTGFEVAEKVVLECLEKYQTIMNKEEDIFNIAKISANNDEEIAKHIQEAFLAIGDNGIVSIADSLSRKGETTVKISSGIEFDRGFLSSLCVNSTNDQCILHDAKFLLSTDILNSPQDLHVLIQMVQMNKWPLIIIAPDFDEEVMAWHREMISKKMLTGSLVLAPGVSKLNIADNLLDLAVLTNATILGQDVSLNDFDVHNHLGSADQVVITKGKTTILGAGTNQERFDKHIEFLQAKVDHDSAEIGYSEYELQNIKERIAKMTGGVATIFIGSLTSVELGEKKDRYEDAINSVRAMLSEGYIPGASTPLLRISYNQFNYCDQFNSEQMSIGSRTSFKSYMKAIRIPSQILIRSSGEDYENVVQDILKLSDNEGFNVKKRKIENLIDSGIIDPYKIIYNSILYASNVAEQFMGLDSIIISDVRNLSVESLDDILNEDGVR